MKKGLMKVVALAAASVMAVAALAGCGSSDKLIMGTNAAFPPFEYTTSQGLVGEFDGIDVAIANKIAENVGKELQIEDMEFDGLVASVSTGKVDMVVAGKTKESKALISLIHTMLHHRLSLLHLTTQILQVQKI